MNFSSKPFVRIGLYCITCKKLVPIKGYEINQIDDEE